LHFFVFRFNNYYLFIQFSIKSLALKDLDHINSNGFRHKISLPPRWLEIANAILWEGLDPLEKRVLEALKMRINRSS